MTNGANDVRDRIGAFLAERGGFNPKPVDLAVAKGWPPNTWYWSSQLRDVQVVWEAFSGLVAVETDPQRISTWPADTRDLLARLGATLDGLGV